MEAESFDAADEQTELIQKPSPVFTILAIVVGGGAVLIGANVALWWWANKNAPPRPKKKLGAKQLKREKLKQGIRPAGDD